MKESHSEFVEHRSHTECGSSDALGVYSDGSGYCFSCETYVPATLVVGETVVMAEEKDINIEGSVVGPITDRKLNKETVQKFGVRLMVKDGVPTTHHYPYYNGDGELVAWKVRRVPKEFHVEGALKSGLLFGQQLFASGGKTITLCEGELDALSSFQMRGSRWPTVSIKNGSTAAYRECKKAFEYLDSFDKIIIDFDNDEQGMKSAREVASLFPKKAHIMMKRLKDASKYLTDGKQQEYSDAWWQAPLYKPDDILSGFDKMWEIAQQPRTEALFQYPWSGLNEFTYGLRPSEFVVITAGSGMGKTQVLRETAHYCLKDKDKENIGLIYLEETAWETAMGLASMEASKPLHLPDTHWTESELEGYYRKTWGTNRVHTLNDSWRDNSVDYLCDKIKYLSKALDCRLIILDHISFMVSDQSGDERKMLDEIAHKLKALTVELDICLVAVCHSKRQATKPLEEGGTTSLSDLRGTAGIGQLANIVLGLERDGQAEDKRERNTTTVRVLKNRFSGRTGVATRLLYDEFTGRMTEVGEETKES